jgi:hypothetical protein
MKKLKLNKSKNTLSGVMMRLLIILAILTGLTNCGGKNKNTQDSDTTKATNNSQTEPVLKKDNGIFEIISIDKGSVKFSTMIDTSLCSVALVSDEQIFEADNLSNLEGDIQLANGSIFHAPSSLPFMGQVMLPKDAVIVVYIQTPDEWIAKKVMFTTSNGSQPMYYDIANETWATTVQKTN